MILNKTTYKYVITLVVLLHIPLFLVIEPFIEFGGVSYPIPVWLIIIHAWLLIESRSVYVNMQSPIHYFGILTGVIGFIPGLMLHVIPNIFVVLYGLFFVGKIFRKGGYKSTKKKGVLVKIISKIPIPKITFGEGGNGEDRKLSKESKYKGKEDEEIGNEEDYTYYRETKPKPKPKTKYKEKKNEDDERGHRLLEYRSTKDKEDNYYEDFGYGSSEEPVEHYAVEDFKEEYTEEEVDWEDVEIDLEEDDWDDEDV